MQYNIQSLGKETAKRPEGRQGQLPPNQLAEVESSRTHFDVLGLSLGLEGQVLGLGLEASSPRKFPCPRLEDSTIF